MTGWLVYDKKGIEKNAWFADQIISYGAQRNADIKLVLCEELKIGTDKEKLLSFNGVKPDFVINRTVFPFLSKYFEQCGVKVFNNAFVSEVCNDKRKTHMYLANKGIDMMESRFFDRRFFCAESADITFPCVVKPANGHGGNGVKIVKNCKELKETVSKYETYAFLCQKIADTPGLDLRVYVMGNKIIGAVLRKSEDDFRSNFSLGGKVEAYTLNEYEEKQVSKVIKHFDLSYAGIDFIFDAGKMKLNEIEDVVGARMLYQTHDIAAHEMYVDYIIGETAVDNKC